MNEDFNPGLLDDNRDLQEKSLDHSFMNPEFATAPVLKWVERDPSQWKRWTTRNQNGSGSCVAQGTAKGIEIALNLTGGKLVDKGMESATPIFQKRQNSPSTGMYLYNALDLAKKQGTTLEISCRSQEMNDKQMDSAVIPDTPVKIGGYVYANPKDIYSVASFIEQYGHCILTFGSNYTEWTSIPSMVGEVKWGHCVCAVDYVIYHGKMYIVIEDSWGHGATDFDDRRLISAEFLLARCTGAAAVTLIQEVVIPKTFIFTKVLKKGMANDDVKHLQDLLRKEGLFTSTATTSYFGNITEVAVKKFQLKYASEILTPAGLTDPTGIVGENTIKKLNQLLNPTNNMQNIPTKDWYMSKTLWVGVLTSVAGLIVVLKDNVPNPEVTGILIASLGVINIILRFLTFTELK